VLVSAAQDTDVAKTWVLDVWDRVPVVGEELSVLKSALVLGLVLLALYSFAATQQNLRAGVSESPTAAEPAKVERIIRNWLKDLIGHYKAKLASNLLDDAEKESAEKPVPPAEPPALPAFALAPSRRRTAIL
jgi:hypothetical protein